MPENENEVFAPVKMNNDPYDSRMIAEDGADPIESEEEDAMAAIKGHIEKQDLEGQ
ncbi:hypothetical protein [Paenibacillus sp. GYB003]|uniref:hypothetical protein n=1 Tax=Paenibacillus sp. GYB003 TaxID=2994392 RepID=UPI002F965FA1